MAGNDADAKQFLAKKSQLAEKHTSLTQTYEIAAANATKMRQMHDKLSKDIADLNARKDSIKAKMAVAKTQEKISKIGSSVAGASNSMSAFDRMEAKANRMLDEANAMAELNMSSAESDIEDLAAKYDSDTVESPALDDELAALKAQMGM
jgi:phage shock protein A